MFFPFKKTIPPMFININRILNRRREGNQTETNLSYQSRNNRFNEKAVENILIEEGVDNEEDKAILLQLAFHSQTRDYHLLPELLSEIKRSNPTFVNSLLPSVRAHQKKLGGNKAFNSEGYSLTLFTETISAKKIMEHSSEEMSRERDDDNCVEIENLLIENHSFVTEEEINKRTSEEIEKIDDGQDESSDESESSVGNEAAGTSEKAPSETKQSDSGGDDYEEGLSPSVISDKAERSRLELNSMLEPKSGRGFFNKSKNKGNNKDNNTNKYNRPSLGAVPKTGTTSSFSSTRYDLDQKKDCAKANNDSSDNEENVNVTDLLLSLKNASEKTKTLALLHSPPKDKESKKSRKLNFSAIKNKERSTSELTKMEIEQINDTSDLLSDESRIERIVDKIIMNRLPQLIEESAREVRTDIEFIYSTTMESFVENASDEPSFIKAESFNSIFEMISQMLAYHKAGFYDNSIRCHKELKSQVEELKQNKESQKINELKQTISRNNEIFQKEIESLKRDLKNMKEKLGEVENMPKYVKTLKSSVTGENFNKHKSGIQTKTEKKRCDKMEGGLSSTETQAKTDIVKLEEKLRKLGEKDRCIQKMINEQSVKLAGDISRVLAPKYETDQRTVYKILRKMME